MLTQERDGVKGFLPGSWWVFVATGLWRPRSWKSPFLVYLYKVFSIFTIFLVYTFTTTSILGIIANHGGIAAVMSDFLLLSFIACCGKSVNMIVCRETIIDVIDTLQTDPCMPRDPTEEDMQYKRDHFVWINTLIYGILTEVTAMMVSVGSLLQHPEEGELPFNTWLPYYHDSGFGYRFAYGQQIISIWFSASMAVAYDTAVPGMMMEICAKLDILKYRFLNFKSLLETSDNLSAYASERKLVSECVECHLIILRLAETINDVFNAVVFLQYSLSTLLICVSIYNLANTNIMSSEGSGIILYLGCMLMEIFIICAAGNELTLVSESISDAIYEMDWTELNGSTIQSLILIMTRTTHPIVFKCGSIVEMSLESFKSLVKLSYSTFNLLQQTSA
ncbi:odorant receptor 46a, isoform B [Fopius arisanus]|uniref:Odorant receptor n=2 Tax=Fopius arisanus TaxID=64838 RepID=A0A9R1TTI1_9HYME|nr:PREDICTED: odorant receptor 46a, isoform B-like [Fopius arisanus]